MATKNLPSADTLHSWSVNDVQDWLKLNGYNEFVLPFRGHKFDGRKLLMLSEQALNGMNHDFPEKKRKSMIKQVEKVRGRKALLKKLESYNKKTEPAPAPAPTPRDYHDEDDDVGWGSDFDDDKDEEDEFDEDEQPDYDLPPDQEELDLPEYVDPTETAEAVTEEYYEDPVETPATTTKSTAIIDEEYYDDPDDSSPQNMPRLPPRLPQGHLTPFNGVNARTPPLPTRPNQAAVPPRQLKTNYPKTVPIKQPPLPSKPEPAAPPRPEKPSHMVRKPPPPPQETEETYEVPEEGETYEVPLDQEQGYIQDELYEVPNAGDDDAGDGDDSDYEEPDEPENDELYEVPDENEPPKTPGNRPPMPLPSPSRPLPTPVHHQPQPQAVPPRDPGRSVPWQQEKALPSQVTPSWAQSTPSSMPPLPGRGPKVPKPALPTPAENNKGSPAASTPPRWKSNPTGGIINTAKPAIPTWKNSTDSTAQPHIPSWKRPQTTETEPQVPSWKKTQNTDTTPQVPAWKKTQNAATTSQVPAWKKTQTTETEPQVPSWKRTQPTETDSPSAKNISPQKSPVGATKWEPPAKEDEDTKGHSGGIAQLRKMFDQGKTPLMGSKPPIGHPKPTVSPHASGDGQAGKPPSLPADKFRSPGSSADGTALRQSLPDSAQPPPLPPGRPEKHRTSGGSSGDGITSRPLPVPSLSPSLPPGRPVEKHRSPGNSADGIASRPPPSIPDTSQLPPARPPKVQADVSSHSNVPSYLERELPPRPVQDFRPVPEMPSPVPPRPPKTPQQQSTPPARPPPQATPPQRPPPQATPPQRPPPQATPPQRPPPQATPPQRPPTQSTPSRLQHKELPQIPVASPSRNEFEGYPFYHGALERVRAESALKESAKNGAFIVRDGRGGINSNDPYTISVWYNGKPWNLKISRRPSGKYALGAVKAGETTFSTPLELVQYHRDNSLVLAGDAGRVCLMIPAPVYD